MTVSTHLFTLFCRFEGCGVEFQNASARAMYCPAHRKEMKRRRCREWRARNPEKARESDRQRSKRRKEADPDYQRRRYAENRERHREWGRGYYRRHAAECRERARRYGQAHREEINARRRAEYRENPEKFRERSRRSHLKTTLRKRACRGDNEARMRLLALNGELRECPRLHVRARELPCGRRPECFGAVRCGCCPAQARPPRMDFGSTAGGW